MAKNKIAELRIRGVSEDTKFKIEMYREYKLKRDGKPKIKLNQALDELINYSYRKLVSDGTLEEHGID